MSRDASHRRYMKKLLCESVTMRTRQFLRGLGKPLKHKQNKIKRNLRRLVFVEFKRHILSIDKEINRVQCDTGGRTILAQDFKKHKFFTSRRGATISSWCHRARPWRKEVFVICRSDSIGWAIRKISCKWFVAKVSSFLRPISRESRNLSIQARRISKRRIGNSSSLISRSKIL